MNTAMRTPSDEMDVHPQSAYTVPPLMKSRLNAAVSTMMNTRGAIDRSACRKGICANANSAKTNTAANASAGKFPAQNMMTTSASAPITLVRGSSACMGLSAAQ
jgi:hypothetical protein